VVARKLLALENPEAEKNVQIFFSVLMLACCMPSNLKNRGTGSTRDERSEDGSECNYIEDCGFSIGLDFMRQVALLFVEIVSPDVMLNGLPWPDLEYSKMLIERDLHIQRTFEDYPYFWHLLELLAKYRPSLCYCSVIVRALMATYIQRWRSAQQTRAVSNPRLLECTIRLLGVMKIGQFIPPPFCYLGDILQELQSREIVGLLEDVWAYMRMHVPVRTAFTQSAVSKNFVRTWESNDFDPFAMDRLRFTILKHAEKVGYLLGRFFPSAVEPETPASPDPGT
jgi:integrator complex subunit 5